MPSTKQDLVDAGHLALRVGQLGLVADAHDRAHRVEEVRQQHREDEQDAGQHADLAEAAEEAELADAARSPGWRRGCRATSGWSGPRTGRSATGVDDHRERRVIATIEIRIAPGTLRTISASVSSVPRTKTRTGQPLQVTVGAELDRDGGAGRRPGCGVTKPASTRPMQHDEQADADAIARLSGRGHGVHDALAQPGRDQEHHDEALEHDQAHRVRPGHPRGDLEGDDRVQAQAGRQRERQVADDAHEDVVISAAGQRGRGRRAGRCPRWCPYMSFALPRMIGFSTMM